MRQYWVTPGQVSRSEGSPGSPASCFWTLWTLGNDRWPKESEPVILCMWVYLLVSVIVLVPVSCDLFWGVSDNKNRMSKYDQRWFSVRLKDRSDGPKAACWLARSPTWRTHGVMTTRPNRNSNVITIMVDLIRSYNTLMRKYLWVRNGAELRESQQWINNFIVV